MMNILGHSAQSATLRLDQRELLLAMALIQAGQESFGCNTDSGKSLDELFTLANILVEEARRKTLKRTMARQKIRTIVTFDPAALRKQSHISLHSQNQNSPPHRPSPK